MADDPCPQWQTMAEVAGIPDQKGNWHCEAGAHETIAGRDTVKFMTMSPQGRSVRWIDSELKFPVKIEIDDGGVFALRNIQEGPQAAQTISKFPAITKSSTRIKVILKHLKHSDVWVEPPRRPRSAAIDRSMICKLPIFAVVAVATLWAAPVHADELAPPQVPSAIAANPLAAHSLDEFAATRDRPLFTPSRRPPPLPMAQRVEPTPAPPPNLTLFGTLVDAEGPSAIVRDTPSGKAVRVRVGDDLDGWKIAQIDDRQLVLSLDDRSVTFTMFGAGHAEEHTGAISHAPPVLEAKSAGH